MAHKGSWFGLPDFGITEKIGALTGAPRTAQGGSNIFGGNIKPKAATPAVQGANTGPLYTPAPMGPPGPPSGYRAPSGGGTYQQTQSSGSYAPQTSGQSAGGDSGGGGGGGFDYLGALRSAFGQSRQALEGILPTYDKDYANYKSTVEGGVNRAKETLNTQNQEDERIYGESLRNLLKTDQELRQRRQGTFSALGALDSSAYKDDVTKGDQALLESQQGLDREKRTNFDARQKEFATYEQQANSQLAQYANEIARAKQALQQSIASVNMDEAASIQNYIDKLSSEAQQINAQREAMALNLAQLQAQGTDVIGNLGRINLGGFANTFGQNLARRLGEVTARYALPQQAVAGSGYINPRTGRNFSDEERRLLGL